MLLPSAKDLRICFGHPAYQVKAAFDAMGTGVETFEVKTFDDYASRIGEADVVVVSGFWRNELLEQATRLKFVQSISAGVNQYDPAAFKTHGVRLASAQGVNMNAVSDHAMSLVLAMARRLPEARDNQAKKFWRPMISDLTQREDELAGKTMLIVGLGRIGDRLARLAKAFEMNVIGTRFSRVGEASHADEVHSFTALPELLPRADYVVLTCPLTPETENLIDATAFAKLKPSSFLVNTARGACVNEAALVSALERNAIAGAGIDTTVEEPLAESSKLWSLPNAFVTPHTGGETRQYEINVANILRANLEKLWAGDGELVNQIV